MLIINDYHPDNHGDASHEDDSLSDVPCVVCIQFSHYLKKKRSLDKQNILFRRLHLAPPKHAEKTPSEARGICPVECSWNVSMEAFHPKVSNVTWAF